MNIVVAGATDAGKTTLLRALINCIPRDERLITVERSLELGLRRHRSLHHDVVELEEVLPDAEGHGGITIQQLVRRTRRHNPSRVHRRRGAGPGGGRDAIAMSQGNNGVPVDHPCPVRGGRLRQTRPVRRAVRARSRTAVAHVADRRRGGLRGVHRQEPAPGRPAHVSPGAGGRRRTGRPGRQSARIFTPSPVDGRAVRVLDVVDQRRRGARSWPTPGTTTPPPAFTSTTVRPPP